MWKDYIVVDVDLNEEDDLKKEALLSLSLMGKRSLCVAATILGKGYVDIATKLKEETFIVNTKEKAMTSLLLT